MDCRICFEKFDKHLRKPTWVGCGHTFCLKCLEDMKLSGRNYICPTCRKQISDEITNYAVLDLIDLNPVFDVNIGLKNEIKKGFKDMEETIKEVNEKCKKKSLEITNKIDLIKLTINERTRELINMITTRKDLLIEEADKLKIKLKKKVETILDTRYLKPIVCDTMQKSELDLLRNKINETKQLLQSNQNKLNQIEHLIIFRLHDVKEFSIGEIGNPDQREYFYNAEQFFKSNQITKAIENLNKVIEINNDFTEAYFLKGRCMERLNRFEQAIQCYDKAIEGKYLRAYNLKGFLMINKPEANSLFEKALELNKTPTSYQDFFIKGESYFGASKYQEAINCFEIAIELNPNYVEAFRYKGMCFEKLENFEQAIEAFEKEIELNPNPNAFKNKGSCLDKLGKYPEAIDFFNKAIALYPNFTASYKSKAICLEKMGKYHEAINCFDKAIELNPKYADAFNGKGKSLDKMGRHLDAIVCFDKAIEINPFYVDAYNNKGITYKSMGKYEEAINCYNKAIELNPRYINAFINKGSILHNNMGRDREAIECYNKAIEINPNFAIAYNNKGIYFLFLLTIFITFFHLCLF